MKDLLVLLEYLLTTIAKLLGPGGARAIVADSLLMKQQLLVINRSRRALPIFRHLIDSCSASGRCFSTHAAFSGLP
jgi:hypothetical protein